MKNPDTSKSWHEKLAEGAENFTPPAELTGFLDVEAYPEWVVNVLKELCQQALPTFRVSRLKKSTPATLGFWLGQNCANFYAIGEMCSIPETELSNRMNLADKFTKRLQDNQHLPGVTNLLSTLNIATSLVAAFESELPKVEKLVHKAFKQALDQSYEEAAEFFQGFSQGLSKKGIVARRLARETTATPIYFVMFHNWQEVDTFKSVPALWDYLKRQGLNEQQLGDIERLSKLCFRVKYRPGKRGRPPKAGK